MDGRVLFTSNPSRFDVNKTHPSMIISLKPNHVEHIENSYHNQTKHKGTVRIWTGKEGHTLSYMCCWYVPDSFPQRRFTHSWPKELPAMTTLRRPVRTKATHISPSWTQQNDSICSSSPWILSTSGCRLCIIYANGYMNIYDWKCLIKVVNLRSH